MLFYRYMSCSPDFSIKSSFLLLLIACFLFSEKSLTAQEAAPLVVMNLAAHPDDEDGRTLTYYRRAKDAIAYSVIYTRGEGGQNEIGPQLYEELGALRSDETERAARILGTQTFFLNFKDFGYSKKAKESFEKWGGEDEVTSRIVYLIRKLKPDVLFTNHDTLTVGPRVQHGQHQAVGISAYNAFELAADPSYHPEQLEEDGVDLWQPKRLFLRRWFGARDGDYEVVVPVTADDVESGKSYTRIATDALAEHASQGMGMFASFRRMNDDTYFTLLRSSVDTPVDTTDLSAGIPPNTTAKPDLSYWIDSGRTPAVKQGLLAIDDKIVVAGQELNITIDGAVYPGTNLRVDFSGLVSASVSIEADSVYHGSLDIGADATPTVPKAIYQYERFVNHEPIVYALYNADTDELIGAGYLPMEVAPKVVQTVAQDVIRLKPGKNEFSVLLKRYDPISTKADMIVSVANDGSQEVLFEQPFQVKFDSETTQRVPVSFSLPDDLKQGAYTIKLTTLASPTSAKSEAIHTFIKGSTFSVDVAANLRVGVIESYDNTLSAALSELGVDFVKLDSAAIATQSYKDLHTVLVDIRAYLVRSDLRDHNEELLDWVQEGGHLVVNYQKMFEWNAQFNDPFNAEVKNPDQLAPYPLQLSRDRVTVEEAPVTVLEPGLPLFQNPNPISSTLWDNWVQERGLYFPGEYSEDYVELFEMADPGEEPFRSSTLFARYGSGTYLYTALGWYRQLKVYHPEVYAFFANMISLPLVDGRTEDAASSSDLE